MRYRILYRMFALSLVLAACSGGTPATPALPTLPPTATVGNIALPAAIEPPAEPTDASPTLTQSNPGSKLAGPVTYKMVPGESQVSYEVKEVFINQGNVLNVAVGITPQISGKITIDPANPQKSHVGTIVVDLSQFKSDSSRRDRVIRDQFLESAKFPEATFVPQKIEGLPSNGQVDVSYRLTISGDLTVHQVTRLVTFNGVVQANEKTLTGEATATVLMDDFGVGPISIAGISRLTMR